MEGRYVQVSPSLLIDTRSFDGVRCQEPLLRWMERTITESGRPSDAVVSKRK